MGRLVSITTPLTQPVSAFVGMLQSKGSAVSRTEQPEVFRQGGPLARTICDGCLKLCGQVLDETPGAGSVGSSAT